MRAGAGLFGDFSAELGRQHATRSRQSLTFDMSCMTRLAGAFQLDGRVRQPLAMHGLVVHMRREHSCHTMGTRPRDYALFRPGMVADN